MCERDKEGFFLLEACYFDEKNLLDIIPKQIKEIKETCVFVLDTNPLLLPYKVGNTELSTEIYQIFSSLIKQNRLKIPVHVLREFVKNRPNYILELYQKLYQKKNSIQIMKLLSKEKSSVLESLTEYTESLEIETKINNHINEIQKLVEKYKDKIDGIQTIIKNWAWNDPISEKYNEIFTDNAIYSPIIKKDDFKKDYKFRTKYRIPPGYKDSEKNNNKDGDLIIWYTILEIGKKMKKDIIFITSDEKSDWWHIIQKERIYPRFELVYEFFTKTESLTFQMINFSGFLELIGSSENLINKVKREEDRIVLTKSDLQSSRSIEKIVDSMVYQMIQEDYKNLGTVIRGHLDETLKFENYHIDYLIEEWDVDGLYSKTGIIVHYIGKSPQILKMKLREALFIGQFGLKKQYCDKFEIFLIFRDLQTLKNYLDLIYERYYEVDENLDCIIISPGYISSGGRLEFSHSIHIDEPDHGDIFL